MRPAVLSLIALVSLFATAARAAEEGPSSAAPPTFTFWQLPAQTHSQMLSGVLRTSSGKVLVIDGGTTGDAPYLRGFLAALGNSVQAWFVTHPHDDHVDALIDIVARPQGLTIDTVYASLPEDEWVAKNIRDQGEQETLRKTRATFDAAKRLIGDLTLGQAFTFDDVHVQVLGIRNPEITGNPINNSSVVLKIWDARKSLLLLGDLGVEGGEKLLHGPYADQLHADYVQMAHHGQNGVGESVYQAIRPTYCLWPTPRWLWDNDPSDGRDSKVKGHGHWKTLQTRAWMEKLNIQHHYLMADGLQRID